MYFLNRFTVVCNLVKSLKAFSFSPFQELLKYYYRWKLYTRIYYKQVWSTSIFILFRFVLASLQEGLSICPSVYPSARWTGMHFFKILKFFESSWNYSLGFTINKFGQLIYLCVLKFLFKFDSHYSHYSHNFREKKHITDQPTNGWTDGPTNPLTEMQGRTTRG